MSSNIQFGTNSAILGAVVTASSAATGTDPYDLLTGSRRERWKTNGAVASAWIKYAVSTAVNYVAIANINLASDLVNSTVTFAVDYSDDDAAYTNWYTSPAATPASFGIGASGEDSYIYNAALSASHPYWRVTITPSGSATVELGKLYLGTAFDPGRDPTAIRISRPNNGQYAYRTGYRIELDYTGISPTQAQSIVTNIVNRASHHPVWIFTTVNHGPLLNQRCFLMELEDATTPNVFAAQNDVSLIFREAV